MSTLSHESAGPWQDVPTLEGSDFGATMLAYPSIASFRIEAALRCMPDPTMVADPSVIATFRPQEDPDRHLKIRGRVDVPGVHVNLPEQEFNISLTQSVAVVENVALDSWPRIRIEFTEDSRVSTAVAASNETVEAQVLSTRVRYCIGAARTFLLRLHNFRPMEFPVGPVSDSAHQALELSAKFFRKLKYIERAFGLEFRIPPTISAGELRLVEIVFRGITEGEFGIRCSDITFGPVRPSEIDLTKPPFTAPGQYSRRIDDNGKMTLLGRCLDVGPVTIHLEKADLADPGLVERIISGSHETVAVRLAILDHQAVHRFERYASPSSKRLAQRALKQFKRELSREEPQELVDLIAEPLANDVSAQEANQIAFDWQRLNNLPDRNCPQDPELDEVAGCWRVPIFRVYPSGAGGRVGELVVDMKTGQIIQHTPIEQLRSRGLALAEEIVTADPEVSASARELIDTIAPPPQFLKDAWADSERQGLDGLSMTDIDAEISAVRREHRKRKTS